MLDYYLPNTTTNPSAGVVKQGSGLFEIIDRVEIEGSEGDIFDIGHKVYEQTSGQTPKFYFYSEHLWNYSMETRRTS